MRKRKSILENLYRYRNSNQLLNDHLHYLAKHGKKVDNFNNLLYLGQDTTSKGYLNVHTHVIVIINNDNFIDNIIYLYDRKLKFFDSDKIEEKARIILDAYYKCTKSEFIEALYSNGTISYKLYTHLLKECL